MESIDDYNKRVQNRHQVLGITTSTASNSARVVKAIDVSPIAKAVKPKIVNRSPSATVQPTGIPKLMVIC
jgi:hypothetical protein